MADSNKKTLLRMELNRSQRDYNGLLRYESTVLGTNGTTRSKSNHVFVWSTPEMSAYLHESAQLQEFVKNCVDSNALSAIFFSKPGWEARNEIKKTTEEKVEKKTCTICLLTCGLAVCCCCGWKCLDRGVENLNEDYYLKQLREQFPEEAREVSYEFVLAQANVAVAAVPSAPLEDPDIPMVSAVHVQEKK